MRYLFFILLALFLFDAAPLSAQEQSPPDISEMSEEERQKLLEKDLSGALRGFVWGLSPTVILEHEPAYFLGEENGTLFYQDFYKDMKVTIAYEFLDNKLWRSKTFVEKKYVRMPDMIDDLLYLQEALTKRLGKPASEDFTWRKNTEKNWPDKWGWAVYRGELFITIKWLTEESEITLYLGSKEPYEPEMTITYVSRKIKEAARKALEDNLLKAPQ
jgi:hypothetical protein